MTAPKKPARIKRHDHRQSRWLFTFTGCNEYFSWCYQCGAMRCDGEKNWTKPTGIDGPNPAMKRNRS